MCWAVKCENPIGMMHGTGFGKDSATTGGESNTKKLDDLQQIMFVLRGEMVRFTSEVAGFRMFAQWIPMMGVCVGQREKK
jgi:hypothetical protein